MRTAWRRDLALVALVLGVTAATWQPLGAQQASRMALTAAIWDDGSLRIDDYPLGPDRAEHDGHLYSDKAPGGPVLAVPVYAVYRLAGGDAAVHRQIDGNLGLWLVSFWSATLPLAILACVVRRAAERVSPERAMAVAITTVLGTLLLPLSTVLFGHTLAALLAFSSWYLVTRASPRPPLVVGGALMGLAVLVEYTMLLPAVAVLAYVAWEHRWRLWAFVGGAVPFAALLLLYQWAAFGSPWHFSYASSDYGDTVGQRGREALDPPLLSNALEVFVGDRGLLLITPVVAFAAVGTVLLVRSGPGQVRRAQLSAGAAALGLVLVQVFWSNPTGGDSPGARYASAAFAFLSPGLAAAWVRWPRGCTVTAWISGALMLAATWTEPLAARDSDQAVRTWVRMFVQGEWVGTLFDRSGGAGSIVGLVVTAGLGVLVAVLLLRDGPGDAQGGDDGSMRRSTTNPSSSATVS